MGLVVKAVVDRADAADNRRAAPREKELDVGMLEKRVAVRLQPLPFAESQRRNPVRIGGVAVVREVDEAREVAASGHLPDDDRIGHADIMVHAVWTSERIALAYFGYLALVCWLRPIGARRRLRLLLVAIVAAVAIRRIAAAGTVVRLWAPAAYILAGYYASAYLFVAPSPSLERWLMAWDRRLLGDPSTAFAAWPRAVLGTLEIVYMGCFILIGAGFVLLLVNGFGGLADHYWTLVVAAEFGAFAPLAFIQTRPPWAIERKPVLADPLVHDLASRMVRHFTIRVNTFPSGHVAGSLAVALAVMPALPWTGFGLLVLALAVAVATVVGRYHYVADAVAGAALAVAIWSVMRALGR